MAWVLGYWDGGHQGKRKMGEKRKEEQQEDAIMAGKLVIRKAVDREEAIIISKDANA